MSNYFQEFEFMGKKEDFLFLFPILSLQSLPSVSSHGRWAQSQHMSIISPILFS